MPAFWHLEVVAPLVGAWIEMFYSESGCCSVLSLLSWERGLKYLIVFVLLVMHESLLSWERGLKYLSQRVDKKEESRSSRGSVD